MKTTLFFCLICVMCLISCSKNDVVDDEIIVPHEIVIEIGVDVIDLDGNIYPTVIIGNQQWTAANLKTTRYANGDSLLYEEEDEVWKDLVSPLFNHGAWCYYDNDPAHNEVFGKLYNWPAAADERNLCPDGWRVPTDEDWHILAKYLDPHAKIDSITPNPFSPDIKMRVNGIESMEAGGYLKSTGNSTNGDGLWQEPNAGANNITLFNALPAGGRLIVQSGNGAGYPLFSELGRGAVFWSATQAANLPPPGAHFRVLSYDFPYLEQRKVFYSSGMSVRCVKN